MHYKGSLEELSAIKVEIVNRKLEFFYIVRELHMSLQFFNGNLEVV